MIKKILAVVSFSLLILIIGCGLDNEYVTRPATDFPPFQDVVENGQGQEKIPELEFSLTVLNEDDVENIND